MPTEPPPPENAITIEELTMGRCHWPLGDPKTQEFRYCGAGTSDAGSRQRERYYCDAHHAIAYTPAPPRRVR